MSVMGVSSEDLLVVELEDILLVAVGCFAARNLVREVDFGFGSGGSKGRRIVLVAETAAAVAEELALFAIL